MLFGAIYIPPNHLSQPYAEFSDTLDLASADFSGIHVLGDFNIPNFVLSDDSTSIASTNAVITHGLTQVNHIYNHRSILLDLIFTTDPGNLVLHDYDLLIPEKNHHLALNLVLSKCFVFNIKSASFPNLKRSVH